MAKKAIRTINNNLPYIESCREFFIPMGILTVPSLYVFESILYIRKHNIKPPEVKHRYETRYKGTYAEQHKLTQFEHKPIYVGLKLF
jgi:hypothetical protein